MRTITLFILSIILCASVFAEENKHGVLFVQDNIFSIYQEPSGVPIKSVGLKEYVAASAGIDKSRNWGVVGGSSQNDLPVVVTTKAPEVVNPDIASEKIRLERELKYYGSSCYSENSTQFCVDMHNKTVEMLYTLERDPEAYFQKKVADERKSQHNTDYAEPRSNKNENRARNKNQPGGVIDPRTGQFFPPVAGGVIDPRSGTFHQKVAGGYINSKTGEFSPD